MKTLYFDCFAGASGNMILGALVALGVDEKELIEQIKLLDIAEFSIEFSTRDKSGIAAVHAEVVFQEEKIHRHLHNIEKIINDSRLSESVKNRAVKIFIKLAEAEAKVHGIDVQKVHFHEVGAIDAIVDVVGACVGFEMLEIERFACSKIHVGSGFVKMAHGKFPVPPPAVAEILTNVPIYSTEIEGELITPTGAAIIATVCEEFGKIPEMRIEKTAYGAGTREYKDFPNALRLILSKSEPSALAGGLTAQENYPQKYINEHELKTKNQKPKTKNLIVIETNIDDLSPQILGFVMERAFEFGCLDCWFTPIQMKKNRPATMVSILCEPEKREDLTALLYTETSTLGVRVKEVERECLPREIVRAETEFGAIDVKIAKYNGEIINMMPEYEQVRKIAFERNVPFRQVKEAVERQFLRIREQYEI